MRIRGIGRGMIALTISLFAIGVDAGIPDVRVSSSGSGATVHVGQVSPFTPATFTDLNTGEEYFVALFATEIEPGVGAVWFALSDAFTSGGGAAGDGVIGVGDATAPVTLSFCSTLGPTAQAGVQNGELFGTQPGGGIKCGEAPRQVVTVTSHAVCEADITVHGFAHINAPYPPFVGNLTIRVRVQQQTAAARIWVTIFTFTGRIDLSGPLSGPVAVGTCS
jgi:hypothetical protein